MMRLRKIVCFFRPYSIHLGYNINDQPYQTIELFEGMKRKNIGPSRSTFILLAGACSVIGLLSMCQTMVGQIPRSLLDTSDRLQSSLIDMWVS